MNKRKYFHTFDALRFFSFLLVFFLHLPKTGKPFIDFFLKSGGIGVSFFFVLSGFLITYILLHEKNNKKKISLKNFFARRILRIWPLFYAMVGFAYLSPYLLKILGVSFSSEGYDPNLLTSILFGENYKMMMTNSFPDGAPLRVMWSLCIEEHFYIIWGIAFFYVSIKKIHYLFIFSILLANISRLIYASFGIEFLDVFTNLDYFVYGAVPAYLLIHKPKYLKSVEKIPLLLKYIFMILTVTVIFILPNYNYFLLKYFSPLILGILFSCIILFTLGENSIHIKDKVWFSKLGKYTYSLYLFHTIIILLMVRVLSVFSLENWCLLVALSLIVTIVFSVVSYHFFEGFFLKFKKYFIS